MTRKEAIQILKDYNAFMMDDITLEEANKRGVTPQARKKAIDVAIKQMERVEDLIEYPVQAC